MSSFNVIGLVLWSALLSLANAGEVNFIDCGNGSLMKLNITPCDSDPCVFQHGATIQIEAVIRAPFGARSATTSVVGNLRGREMAFPNDNENICLGKIKPSCPVKRGRIYTYTSTFHIRKMIPAQPMEVTYKGMNEVGQELACARLNVRITKI